MLLMVEHLDDSIQPIIQESSEGKKSHYIEGIFAQAELPNRNKRIYPLGIMEREVTKFQKMIEGRRAIGELNHPNHPQPNPERASHLITELRFDGNNVMGKAKILSTPIGQIVKSLLEDGVQLGVSTRGLGSVKKNSSGINEVQDDFMLATIDIVSDPSGIDCFVNGIMEGAEWVNQNGQWIMVEKIKDEIKQLTTKEISERQSKWFKMFLASL